ncbi:MAG TPA: hypothetical protein PKM43_02960 [Verrucomicrobiota bacterium]|nr:hypothetical protein [Verrucomicrobiota bacterium]
MNPTTIFWLTALLAVPLTSRPDDLALALDAPELAFASASPG